VSECTCDYVEYSQHRIQVRVPAPGCPIHAEQDLKDAETALEIERVRDDGDRGTEP
jgi:hypothetical protein